MHAMQLFVNSFVSNQWKLTASPPQYIHALDTNAEIGKIFNLERYLNMLECRALLVLPNMLEKTFVNDFDPTIQYSVC